jgi:hypothetical protein
MTNIEKAIAVLRKTNDGEDLSPLDLAILEHAVNGLLSQQGEERFRSLYESVMAGTYMPWFHGIEGMRLHHDGWVTYKGKKVEHYSFPWAYTEEARQDALEILERCKYLESIGITPTMDTVVWHWEKYQQGGIS